MKRLTLRLKVWQILLAGLALCLLAVPLLFPSLGYWAAGRVVSLWDPQLADGYYAQSVRAGGPGALNSWQARAETALASCGGYLDSYLISGSGVSTGGSGYLTPDGLDALARELDALCGGEYQGDRQIQASLTMAALWHLHGEEGKAQALADSLPAPKDPDLAALVCLHRGAMAIARGDYAAGQALLEEAGLGDYDILGQWLLYCARQMEAFQAGEPLAAQPPQRQPDWDAQHASARLWPLAQPLLSAANLEGPFRQLDQLSRPLGGDNTLTGRVDGDRKGGWVVLSVTRESSVNAFSSSDFAPHYAVAAVAAGPDGTFSLSGLPDGRYTLGLATLSSTAANRSISLEGGTVYDLAGGETADAGTIHILPVEGSGTITFDGSAGWVEAQGLPPAHRYRIRLSSRLSLANGTIIRPIWESGLLQEPSAPWTVQGAPLASGSGHLGEPSPQEYLPPCYGVREVTATVEGYDEGGALLWSTGRMGGLGRLEQDRFTQEITFTQPTQADRLLLAGEYDQAIPLYREAALAGDGYAAVILGNLYQHGWRWTPAYDQEGNLLPDQPREGGDLEEAAAWWEKALEAFPGEEDLLAALGECRWRLGQGEEALALFQQMTGPGRPQRWIGLLQWQLGRPREAVATWEEAGCQEEVLLARMLLGEQEGIPELADGIRDEYYRERWQAAAAAWAGEDLAPYGEVFRRMEAGRPQEAIALLQGREEPAALFLQGIGQILASQNGSWDPVPQLDQLRARLAEEGSPYAGVLDIYLV